MEKALAMLNQKFWYEFRELEDERHHEVIWDQYAKLCRLLNEKRDVASLQALCKFHEHYAGQELPVEALPEEWRVMLGSARWVADVFERMTRGALSPAQQQELLKYLEENCDQWAAGEEVAIELDNVGVFTVHVPHDANNSQLRDTLLPSLRQQLTRHHQSRVTNMAVAYSRLRKLVAGSVPVLEEIMAEVAELRAEVEKISDFALLEEKLGELQQELGPVLELELAKFLEVRFTDEIF